MKVLTNRTISTFISKLSDKGVSSKEAVFRITTAVSFINWLSSTKAISENDTVRFRNELYKTKHELLKQKAPLGSFPLKYVGFSLAVLSLLLIGGGIYLRFYKNVKTPFAYSTAPLRAGRIISFQGRMTDTLGNPITAPIDVTYNFYTASTGGSPIASSTRICTAGPDQDGVFNTLIGNDAGGSGGTACNQEIPASIFTENTNVYLGVTVGTEPSEMTPRQQIANVGYAINSETLQGMPPGQGLSNIPFINQDGNMLIAAANPGLRSTYASSNFTISSAQATTIQSAGSGDITLSATEGGNLRFKTYNGSLLERMTILNTGSVGIGTTAPRALLDVNGNATVSGSLVAGGQIKIGEFGSAPTTYGNGSMYYDTTSNKVYFWNGSAWTDMGSGATQYFQRTLGSLAPTNITDDLNLGAVATGSAIVHLPGLTNQNAWFNLGTGNVGIGTTGPTQPLEIKAGSSNLLKISSTGLLTIGYTNNSALYFASDAGATLARYAGDTYLDSYGVSSGNLHFRTGNTPSERMLIDSSGNVGIGTTAPAAKLDVNGNLNVSTYATVSASLALGTSSASAGPGNLSFSGTLNPGGSAGTAGYFLTSNGNSATPTWTNTVPASSVPFSGITSGTNTTAAMVVGTGASLTYSPTGTINASSLIGATWAAPGTIGNTTPAAGNFTTIGVTTQGSGAFTTLSTNSTGNALTLSGAGANISFSGAGLAQITTVANQNLALMPGGTGNVGIGTTAPAAKLDVNGNLNVSTYATMGASLALGSSSASAGPGNLDMSGNLSLSGAIKPGGTAGTTGYVLTSTAGGVNTWSDPAVLVGGTNYWQETLGSLAPKNITDALNLGAIATTSALVHLPGTNNQNAWFNLGTGNVGIGTTNPGARLDVTDSNFPVIRANRGSQTTDAMFSTISLMATKTTAPGDGFGAGLLTQMSNNGAAATNLGVMGFVRDGGDYKGKFVIQNNNGTSGDVWSQNLVVTSSGNVGIGTTAPLAALHLGSDAGTAASGIQFGSDVNLYRSSANILKTDDNVVTGGYINTGATLYADTSVLTPLLRSRMGTGAYISLVNDGGITITNDGATSVIPLTVKGITSQTADLQQWQNSSGTALVVIDKSGNVGIGTTAPGAKLDIVGNLNVSTYATVSASLALGTSSAAAGPGHLDMSGNLTIAGAIKPGGAAGTSGYLLTSSAGGVNTWTDPSTLGSGFNLWQRTLGSVAPLNITDDVNVGAIATGSAMVHLPGTTNQNAFFNLGTGNVGIGTTNPQSALTLGGSGTIANGLTFGTANTGFYVPTATGLLYFVQGGTQVAQLYTNGIGGYAGGSGEMVNIDSTATVPNLIPDYGDTNTGIGAAGSDILSLIAGGTNGLNVNSSGNVGIGTTTPTALLDVSGAASVSGTLAFHAGTGTIQSTTFSNLTLGGTTTGNIVLSPSNDIAGGNIAPNVTNVTDLGTSSKLFRNIYGTNIYQGTNLVCDAGGNNCPSGAGLWNQSLGALYPTNNTVDVLFGATAGATATTSAKFAFTGVNSGTPTASISGTTANVSAYLTGNGNLATTNMTNLVLGGASTGNIQLAAGSATPAFVLTTAGQVGIGTTGPSSQLNIKAASFGSFKDYITLTNNSGFDEVALTQGLIAGYGGVIGVKDGTGGAGYARLEYNVGYPQLKVSADNFSFLTSAGGLTFASTYIALKVGSVAFYTARSDGTDANLFIPASAAQKVVIARGAASQTANLQEWQNSAGTALTVVDKSGNVGIGTTAPAAKLDIVGNLNVSTYATVSASLALGTSSASAGPGNLDMGGNLSISGAIKPGGTAGTTGYLLTSSAGGVNTWTDPTSIGGGSNLWQRTLSSLAPINITDALNIGAIASTSALVHLPGTNNQNAWFNLGTGNVGIGTTGPGYKLDVVGDVRADSFIDSLGAGAYFLDPANPATSLSTGGDINVAGGAGKISVATVDPPYTINGQKYATYLPSMTGVKEETTGKITLNMKNENTQTYYQTVDLTNQPEGSDMWLFSKATNIKNTIDQLTVLLSTTTNAKVWYQIDTNNTRLTFFSNSPAEVSYRLTAPRFDSSKWANRRNENDTIVGLVINDQGNTVSSPSSLSLNKPELAPIDQQNIVYDGNIDTFKQANSQYYLVGDFIEGFMSVTEALIGRLKTGFIETENVVVNNILVVKNKMVSPIIETNEIKPTNGDLTVILGSEATPESSLNNYSGQAGMTNDQKGALARLVIKGFEGKTVATIDASGNASFSGNLASQSLTTESASISGTLIAKTIQSENINAIESNVASMSSTIATNTSQFTNDINAVQQELATLKNQPLPNPAYYQNIDASYDNITVNDTANIYKAHIADSLVVGTLFIQPSSILALSDDLRISSLSTIRLFDDAVVIAKNGDIAIKGEVTANSLAIKNTDGAIVASIDASGSARFNEVIAKKFTLDSIATQGALIADSGIMDETNTPIPAIKTNAEVAGTGTLPQDTKELIIYNDNVTPNSLIYLTPTTSNIQGQLSITKKSINPPYFVVSSNNAIHFATSFNWLIIN